MRILKKALILLHLYLLFSPCNILANFGESCSPLPVSFTDNYLRTQTAYGHILGNIDMITHITGACDPTNEQFTFCLRMPLGNPQICTPPITLNIGDQARLGDLSTNPLLGGSPQLKDIILTVVRVNDSICLTMPTSRGPMPLACKTTNIASPPVNVEEDPICRPIGNSCYDGHKKSQSVLNFSGVAVHCLKETLDKVFFKQNICLPPDEIQLSMLRPFPAFQEALKTWIRAALLMYVIFFGFKILLNPGHTDYNQATTFVMKFILVIYFAVGLGPVFYNQGKETTQNGMLEYALPFLSQAAPQLAQFVFGAGGSKGLCEFDPAKYQPGYEFYALWDSVDCRIGYYLGMQLLYNTTKVVSDMPGTPHSPPGASSSTSTELVSTGSKEALPALYEQGSFRFFVVLFGLFMSGNIILVAAGLVFSIIFISIILNFLTSYLVCLITLYVMAYISPIFIPMALFERTHGYFDAWLKITISCVIQPAVLAGFVALLLTMYDTAIYKNCQFKRFDYTIEDVNFSTFELRVPEAEPEKCRTSAGYKFLQYYTGEGWEKINVILFPIYFLRDVFNLLVEMFYVLIFTIIFYYFSKSISEFASEITNGPAMDAVTAGPTRVVKAVKKAGEFVAAVLTKDAKKLKEMGKDAAEEFKPRAGGQGSGGGGEAKDSASSGGGDK